MAIRHSQLDIYNRISRVLIGIGLIGGVMAAPAFIESPLGYLMLLPLLGLYPLMTGLLGEDPIDGLLTRYLGGYSDHRLRPSSRVALLAVGAGAIGIILFRPELGGELAWLSLVGIYPLMLGLFGEDLLLKAIREVRRVGFRQAISAKPVKLPKHRQTRVQDGKFGPHGHRHAA